MVPLDSTSAAVSVLSASVDSASAASVLSTAATVLSASAAVSVLLPQPASRPALSASVHASASTFLFIIFSSLGRIFWYPEPLYD